MPASSRKGMRRNECKSKEQPDPGTAQGNAPPGAGKDPPLPLFRGGAASSWPPCSVAAQLYVPILCGSAIDLMLGKGRVDFAGVMQIIVQICAPWPSSRPVAQWLLSVCNNRITFSVSRDLRNAALRKIQTLPLSYLDSHPSGDIVSRMIADVDTFADGLLMGFTQLFTGVLTIFGTLLFMLCDECPHHAGGGLHHAR